MCGYLSVSSLSSLYNIEFFFVCALLLIPFGGPRAKHSGETVAPWRLGTHRWALDQPTNNNTTPSTSAKNFPVKNVDHFQLSCLAEDDELYVSHVISCVACQYTSCCFGCEHMHHGPRLEGRPFIKGTEMSTCNRQHPAPWELPTRTSEISFTEQL